MNDRSLAGHVAASIGNIAALLFANTKIINDYTDPLKPEAIEFRKTLAQKYALSTKVPDYVLKQMSFSTFDKFTKARFENVDKLVAEAKTPIQNPDLRQNINKLLKKSQQEMQSVEREYVAELAQLKNFAMDKKCFYGPDAFLAVLKHKEGPANVALEKFKAGHEAEKASLKELLTQANITEENQKPYLDALEKSHKASLESFTKHTSDLEKKLEKAAIDEFHRVVLMAQDAALDPKLEQKLREKAGEYLNTGHFTLESATDEAESQQRAAMRESILFRGSGYKDLSQINTQSGRKINLRPGTKEVEVDGFDEKGQPKKIKKTVQTTEYLLDYTAHWWELPGRFKNIFDAFNPNNTRYEDALTIAERIKASGSPDIEMEVYHDNPEKAMEMARDAYRACLAAGFEPDQIKIGVRHKESKDNDAQFLSHAAIFKGNEGVLNQINTHYMGEAKNRRQELNKEILGTEQEQKFKGEKAVQDFRRYKEYMQGAKAPTDGDINLSSMAQNTNKPIPTK